MYQYPDVEELNKEKIEGIFLGHYFNWDSSENKDIAENNGFKLGTNQSKDHILVLKI